MRSAILLFAVIACFQLSPAQSLAQDAAPSPTPKGSPTPSATPARPVPALGEWLRTEPEPADEEELEEDVEDPERHDFRREDAQERRIFKELLKRYSNDQYDIPNRPPVIKRTVLNRAQRKRITKMRSIQRTHVRGQNKKYITSTKHDSRGLPEIRVCSLNLGGYSDRTEVRRVLKDKKALKEYRKKEKEIVKAIIDEACTVVAVQGVVGTSLKRAQDGLAGLATKLSEEGEYSWRSYLGASNHRLAYNGFLVSNFNIEVETVKSLAASPLIKFGEFEEETFFRGPFEIVLNVGQRSSDKRRKVILITWYLRKSFDPRAQEEESSRIQMASSLRRIGLKLSREFNESPRPLLVLLGDREGGRYAPASKVLEGRLRMKEFLSSGRCVLKKIEEEAPERATDREGDAEGKKKRRKKKKQVTFRWESECVGSPAIKQFFGVIAENPPSLPILVEREVDGEKLYFERKKDRNKRLKARIQSRQRSAEIYLLQTDLLAAWASASTPGRYAVAVRELKYLPETSPLVRVDLNW